MDEPLVRERAEAICEALVAGDVERALGELSDELRRNAGEVLSMLPLPATEATIESVELGGSGFNVVLRLVSETDEDLVRTRWKDRDGEAKVVEVSHLSRTARAAEAAAAEIEAEAKPGGDTETS
jgi:hypothetical protein